MTLSLNYPHPHDGFFFTEALPKFLERRPSCVDFDEKLLYYSLLERQVRETGRHPATAVTDWRSHRERDWSSVILAFHCQADTVQSVLQSTFQTLVDGLVHMAGQILGNIFTPTSCIIFST